MTQDEKFLRIDIRMCRLSQFDPERFADILGICREIAMIPADADRDQYPDDDIVQDLAGFPPSITHADILGWHKWRADLEEVAFSDGHDCPVLMVA